MNKLKLNKTLCISILIIILLTVISVIGYRIIYKTPEYYLKHVINQKPTTLYGTRQADVKMDLNNGYYFYYFKNSNKSQILYGERLTMDLNIAVVLEVRKFIYNENYIFAIGDSTAQFDTLYAVIDSKQKSPVYYGDDKDEFFGLVQELYGSSNYDWILYDGTISDSN